MVGLMSRKQQEFPNLQQGSVSVCEYNKKLNYLAWYGGHNVDNEANKMELFKKGLNAQLCEHLTLFRSGSFNELVSAAIEQEDVSHARMDKEDRKRKRKRQ
jgi:hypothetical protein